jgi:hypothetical protein
VLLCCTLVLLLGCCGCGPHISAQEARRTALGKLAAYCANERLAVSQFSEKPARLNPRGPWSFEFISVGPQRHEVLIYVDIQGKTEVHRMID